MNPTRRLNNRLVGNGVRDYSLKDELQEITKLVPQELFSGGSNMPNFDVTHATVSISWRSYLRQTFCTSLAMGFKTSRIRLVAGSYSS